MILKRIYFAIFIGEVGSATPFLIVSREGNAFCRGHLFWKSFPDRGGRYSQRSIILCGSLRALDPKTRRVLSLLRGSNPACVPEHGRRKELLPLRIRPSRLWTQSSPVLSKRELTTRKHGSALSPLSAANPRGKPCQGPARFSENSAIPRTFEPPRIAKARTTPPDRSRRACR